MLDGKVALVTGAGSGLGRTIVDAFRQEGAKVGVLELDAAKAEKLESDLGDDVTVTIGDATSLADNRAAVDATVRAHGGLDVFVGNAGVWDYNTTLEDLPDDALDAAFDELFHLNVKGYLLGAKAAVPALRSRDGAMVFTLSNAAFYPGGGGPLYTAAKHAGVGLVRQLAYELAPIRVNAVAPGGMATDLRGLRALGMQGVAIRDAVPIEAFMAAGLPVRRALTPEDYAWYYVLLASDRGRASTGVVLQCDGGLGVLRFPPPEG